MATYVYKDKYGITHATTDAATAQQYGAGGYTTYSGGAAGGYPTDKAAAKKALASVSSTGGGSKSSGGGGYSYGGYASPYEVEAALGMGGMAMPETQIHYGPTGGYYYMPTSGGDWQKYAAEPFEAGVKWAQTQFGNMTQGQGVANTNEVINRLMEAIIRQQTPTIVYPEYPQYTPPSPANLAGEPPLTWEQATQRATEMVNPLAEAARTRTIQMFQEQRERLPYQLAAKGQLSQGALRNAEEALTQAQALALEQIDMQKLAQALETARQLQTTTQEQAAANLATQWQQWLAQQEANLQRAQLTATEQWRQYEARRNILAQLVAWLMQQQGLERADELAALQAALQISPFITNPLAFAQSYGYWPAAS